MTTLVVHDLTLGNENEIVNPMCILAATQGDGTLLYPDSFQKEDTVELYVGLGQAHLEGVLWLLETELVLVFWVWLRNDGHDMSSHCSHSSAQ